MELPGLGTYYRSQEWKFLKPTKIGDEVVVRVTITSINRKRRRIHLLTEARVSGELIATGKARVGIDDYPYAH